MKNALLILVTFKKYMPSVSWLLYWLWIILTTWKYCDFKFNCSTLNILYDNAAPLIYSTITPWKYLAILQRPEYILWYSSNLNIFCVIPAPWIRFVKFKPTIYFTILQQPQYILCYSSTLNIFCVIPAPWSTWNCSFSGLLSWLPTTCWNFDLSTFGELVVPKSSKRIHSDSSQIYKSSYTLHNRPFWLLVRSIYDSFKYQGLVSQTTLNRNKF